MIHKITPVDIQTILTNSGMTQTAFAKIMDVPLATVNRWVKGRTPMQVYQNMIYKKFKNYLLTPVK